MELRKYKYIKNTGNFPGYKGGKTPTAPTYGQQFKSNLRQYGGSAISSGIGFYGALSNSFSNTKNSNELVGEAGSNNGNINGFGFQRVNDIDQDSERGSLSKENTNSTLSSTGAGAAAGAAIGSIIPGLGTVAGGAIGGVVGLAGGLFGASKRKRELEYQMHLAQLKVDRTNQFNMSNADTQSLQQQYGQKYGDTSDDVLYANKGKDNMMKYNTGKTVYTPDGKYASAPTNSLVGKGEGIYNQNAGTATYVDKGKVGVDNQQSSVQQNDNNIIFGNEKIGNSTFAKLAAPYIQQLEYINKQEKQVGAHSERSSLSKTTKDLHQQEVDKVKGPLQEKLNRLAELQKRAHAQQGQQQTNRYWDGKDLVRQIPAALGTIASIKQYNDYNNDNIKYRDTYTPNPYAAASLNGMAGLRINSTPLASQIYGAERRGQYAYKNMGGLTTGQRQTGAIAAAAQSGSNAADMYRTVQEKNLGYKQNYYQMLAQLGQQDAEARTQANRYDWQDYTAAHGAKTRAKDVAMSNIISQINSGFANESKYGMWKDTMGLYQQDMDNKRNANAVKYNIPYDDYIQDKIKNNNKNAYTNDYNIG